MRWTRTLTSAFARTLVRKGLLVASSSAEPPSAGMVAAALGDLIQRLRYVLGEYGEEPEPVWPRTWTHSLEFDSAAAAERCRSELAATARGDRLREVDGGIWSVDLSYLELPPDQGFRDRERELTRAAQRLGGRYRGSGG